MRQCRPESAADRSPLNPDANISGGVLPDAGTPKRVQLFVRPVQARGQSGAAFWRDEPKSVRDLSDAANQPALQQIHCNRAGYHQETQRNRDNGFRIFLPGHGDVRTVAASPRDRTALPSNPRANRIATTGSPVCSGMSFARWPTVFRLSRAWSWIGLVAIAAVATFLLTRWGDSVSSPHWWETGAGNTAMDMTAGENLSADFAHDGLVVLTPPEEVPHDFHEALGAIYSEYRSLADAFTNGQIEAIDRAARRMRVFVVSLHARGASQQAKRAWANHREVLRTALHQIETVGTLEQRRVHFSHVSEAMYCALKSFTRATKPIYVAYCPEALNANGAYWLSDSEATANPYAPGREACVELRETL